MSDILQAAVDAQRGKRAKGFYWVQHNKGEWEIAHWGPSDIGDAPSWIIVGSDDRGDDSDMVEIDERPIMRSENLSNPFVSFPSLFAGHTFDGTVLSFERAS